MLLAFLNFILIKLNLTLSESLKISTLPRNKLLIIKGPQGFYIFQYKILQHLILSTDRKHLLFFKVYLNSIFSSLEYINKKLILIKGVGFKFELKKTKNKTSYLRLKAGYNSPIIFKYSQTVFKLQTPKPTRLLVSSINTQILFLFLLYIKKYRIPDVYKGKGIFFRYEKLNKKVIRKSK